MQRKAKVAGWLRVSPRFGWIINGEPTPSEPDMLFCHTGSFAPVFWPLSGKIHITVAHDWQGDSDHRELPHSVFPAHGGVKHTFFCTIV